MNKEICNILNHINQGFIVTNDRLEIVFLNKSMKDIINTKDLNFNKDKIYEIIPRLNKEYFKKAMKDVIEKDYKYFFSSSMHKNLLSETMEVNLQLSRFQFQGKSFLIIESTDVTSQIARINQYKDYNKELHSLNKKLKEKEKKIEKLAYYDGLTGLVNRNLFYILAKQIMNDSKRNEKKMGLMFIDVDKFKSINDLYGHMVGDRILVEMSKILKESTRENDIISRHGGDEFIIILPDIKEYDDYKVIASRIANANKKIIVDASEIHICLSIGISFYPRDGKSMNELITKADRAMYQVKDIGGNEFKCYEDAKSNIITTYE